MAVGSMNDVKKFEERFSTRFLSLLINGGGRLVSCHRLYRLPAQFSGAAAGRHRSANFRRDWNAFIALRYRRNLGQESINHVGLLQSS